MQQPEPPPKLNLRKLESIQRFLRYIAAAVLVVFLALIGYSGYKLSQITNEISVKQAEVDRLDVVIKKQTDALAELNKRVEILNSLDQKRPVSAEQAREVEKTVESKIGELTNAKQIPPRVYIQFARDDQAKRVSDVARQLQARGFLTPGISQARGRASRVTQLRYYQTDEVTQTDLRNLMEFFRSVGVRLGEPMLIRDASGVRPRHYDLAFGDDFGRAPAVETRPTPIPEPTQENTPEPTRTATPRPTRTPRPTPGPTPKPPVNVSPARPHAGTPPTRLSTEPSSMNPFPSGK